MITRILSHSSLVLVLAAACAGCNAGSRVLVVESTKTFHTASCPRVSMARTVEMSVAEAERLGCRPCPVCRPVAAR